LKSDDPSSIPSYRYAALFSKAISLRASCPRLLRRSNFRAIGPLTNLWSIFMETTTRPDSVPHQGQEESLTPEQVAFAEVTGRLLAELWHTSQPIEHLPD